MRTDTRPCLAKSPIDNMMPPTRPPHTVSESSASQSQACRRVKRVAESSAWQGQARARVCAGLVAGAGDLAGQRVQSGPLAGGQGDVQRGGVLFQPLDPLGARNGDDRDAEPLLL